ncbi:hypothetical protein SynSYN20_01679 [Synechococcus sp. SYN20]|uniref:hypothetical protein n=1 Tax=Synechococcus sp. SYN20 TaxID=1050714 RepID=UPI001644EA26|nr:hypothetical protein [Synechococcus sp. SYN20]QNJ26006.1 hypothetical protein SynSYN20_01679 [Synechococcus sp. SYN20]
MFPEALAGVLIPLVLGWMGFTWKRTDRALDSVERVSDKIDKVELKMAENFVTKADFHLSIERMMKGIDRLDKKTDLLVFDQSTTIRELKSRLRNHGEDAEV